MPLNHHVLLYGLAVIALFQGVFALFTMYLPPLFPTLLRTTGAGFCYNIGRIAAGLGTVFFGLSTPVGDHRLWHCSTPASCSSLRRPSPGCCRS